MFTTPDISNVLKDISKQRGVVVAVEEAKALLAIAARLQRQADEASVAAEQALAALEELSVGDAIADRKAQLQAELEELVQLSHTAFLEKTVCTTTTVVKPDAEVTPAATVPAPAAPANPVPAAPAAPATPVAPVATSATVTPTSVDRDELLVTATKSQNHYPAPKAKSKNVT